MMRKMLIGLFLLLFTILDATELKRDGWNLISACQNVNRTDINMSGIAEIQHQDGRSIYTGAFAAYSNLEQLEAGYAYWIKADAGSYFESGISRSDLVKPLLRTGWNLMAACEDIPKENINLTDIEEIQNQDGNTLYTGKNAPSSNLEQLTYGYGYWVKGDQNRLFPLKDANETASSLAAPSSLFAFSDNNRTIIEWDAVEGAIGYNLYWSTSPDVSKTSGTRISNVTSGYFHDVTSNQPYYYIVTAYNGSGESDRSEEVNATTGGAYQLLHYGNGMIDSIIDDNRTQIPFERRIHVLLLAEGYTDSINPHTGKNEIKEQFREDCQDWVEETLYDLEGYHNFKDAFMIWMKPAASASHMEEIDMDTLPTLTEINDETLEALKTLQPNTPYHIPVQNGVVQTEVTIDGKAYNNPLLAQKVWDEAVNFRYGTGDAYYPVGPDQSVTRYIAKNLLAHILVLDPSDGQSGLSGRSKRLQNPDDPSKILSISIAHGKSHEFTHAHARLEDEYLKEGLNQGIDNALVNHSATLQNVVTSNKCSELPWQHLLYGGKYNPDIPNLIGAFGREETGYHAEFKTLMNGRADNGLYYDFDSIDNYLRNSKRLGIFNREVLTFRIMERVGILDEPDSSWQLWVANYRDAFYRRFGLGPIPDPLVDENSDPILDSDGNPIYYVDDHGNPMFEPCDPTPPLCESADWSYIDDSCQSNDTLTRIWTKRDDQCDGGIVHPSSETINCHYQDPATVCLGEASETNGVCNLSVTLPEGEVAYFGNYSLETDNTNVKRAVFVLHGVNRDPWIAYNNMIAAAKSDGEENRTLIIAPYFKTASDNPTDNELYWGSGWSSGSDSVEGFSISSFEVMDRIIHKVVNAPSFPNITDIVVIGHSAGGQFVQRYSAGSMIGKAGIKYNPNC